jgi:uncharacterized protein YndB with AHSA1/START domain
VAKTIKNIKHTAKREDLVISRIFKAPREAVWKAWTDPEGIKNWWGPENFTAPEARIDLRPGGKYVFCMRGVGLDGVVRDFWSTGVYREIVPLKKIVCTDSFADPEGNVVPATYYGMSEDFPLEMEVTVTLEDEMGGTRMTLHHAGIPEGEMKDLTGQGWNGSFDKLARLLETPKEEKKAA